MKEALMIIASAWSVVFVILFVLSIMFTDSAVAPGVTDVRAHVIFALFVGAVTGCGWLYFRSEMKKMRRMQ